MMSGLGMTMDGMILFRFPENRNLGKKGLSLWKLSHINIHGQSLHSWPEIVWCLGVILSTGIVQHVCVVSIGTV